MEAEKEIATLHAKSQGCIPIYISVVKENVNSLFKSDTILLITNRTLNFYNTRNGIVKNVFSLLKLTGISWQKDIVKFAFSNVKFQIECNDYENVLGAVGHVLKKLLTPTELVSLSFEIFGYKEWGNYGNAPYYSLLERASVKNIVLNEKDLSLFKNFLDTASSVLNLGEYSDFEIFFEVLHEVLPMCDKLKYLIVPRFKKNDVYKKLFEYRDSLKKLERMDIDGPVTEYYTRLMEAFLQPFTYSFTAFGLSNSLLSKTDLLLFRDFAVSNKLNTIAFHNAMQPDAMNHFYRSFFIHPIMSSLIHLDLSDTFDLSIDELVPNLANVVYLSVQNCNIEIYDLFVAIEKYRLLSLNVLNISQNLCRVFHVNTVELPVYLETIIADKILWSDESFNKFFQFLLKRSEPLLNVSVAYATFTEQDWKVFNHFTTVTNNFSLSSLIWDGNLLSETFISFLMNNTHLKRLSLNCCFVDSNFRFMKPLENLLLSSKIEDLSIQGSNTSALDNHFIQLLRILTQMSSLKILDISNNGFGNYGIPILKKLIHGSVKFINFDSSKIDDYESLISLLTDQTVINSPCKISFPIVDIDRLVSKGKITDSQKQSLINKIGENHVDVSVGNFPTPASSPYAENYGYYVFKREHFPYHYLSAHQISKIRKNASHLANQRKLRLNEADNHISPHKYAASVTVSRKFPSDLYSPNEKAGSVKSIPAPKPAPMLSNSPTKVGMSILSNSDLSTSIPKKMIKVALMKQSDGSTTTSRRPPTDLLTYKKNWDNHRVAASANDQNIEAIDESYNYSSTDISKDNEFGENDTSNDVDDHQDEFDFDTNDLRASNCIVDNLKGVWHNARSYAGNYQHSPSDIRSCGTTLRTEGRRHLRKQMSPKGGRDVRSTGHRIRKKRRVVTEISPMNVLEIHRPVFDACSLVPLKLSRNSQADSASILSSSYIKRRFEQELLPLNDPKFIQLSSQQPSVVDGYSVIAASDAKSFQSYAYDNHRKHKFAPPIGETKPDFSALDKKFCPDVEYAHANAHQQPWHLPNDGEVNQFSHSQYSQGNMDSEIDLENIQISKQIAEYAAIGLTKPGEGAYEPKRKRRKRKVVHSDFTDDMIDFKQKGSSIHEIS